VFKDAWNAWVNENTELVDTEVRRLSNMNYDGDVLEKMFKSARYYFRKKTTEKKEPQKRRAYIGVQKELLDAMDDYISQNMVEKPSNGFEDFCNSNKMVIQDEVDNLVKSGVTDVEEIHDKIKKTFKNRYFMLISK
jgi:hypothetical protein